MQSLGCPRCPTLPNLAQGNFQKRCPMPYRAGQRIGPISDRTITLPKWATSHNQHTPTHPTASQKNALPCELTLASDPTLSLRAGVASQASSVCAVGIGDPTHAEHTK